MGTLRRRVMAWCGNQTIAAARAEIESMDRFEAGDRMPL
jgi:hypothetical protein